MWERVTDQCLAVSCSACFNASTIRTAMGRVKNPACTVANEAMRQMTSYGAALGLDPASRARLVVPKSKKSNAFSAILGGKRGN